MAFSIPLRFLLAAILLAFQGKAQVVELGNFDKKQGYLFINKQTAMVTTSSVISFDSARHLFENNIGVAFLKKDILIPGFDPHFNWFRIITRNNGPDEKHLVFMQGGLGVRVSELFQSNNGQLRSLGKNGYSIPLIKRPYRNLHYYFPVRIEPHSVDTFYLFKEESHAMKATSFCFIHESEMARIDNRFYFVFGLLLGLLLIFIFLNIYLYLAIKEKIHLWYSAYLFLMLLFIVKDEGLDMEFLGLDSELGYRMTSMAALAAWAVGLQVKVVQLFIINMDKQHWLSKVLDIIKWLLWTGGLAFWIVFLVQPPHWVDMVVFHWTNKALLLAFLVIPIYCFISYRKGYKPALFILAGLAALIIGSILRALFIPLRSFIYRPTYFEIGMALEVIIISYGLMYRYNLFRKEREQLRVELEQQERETASQVMAAQEAEQKRIAQDLHDEMGGNLAAIKMMLQRLDIDQVKSEEINKLIDQVSTNARNISHNLMPPEFEEISLGESLQLYYRRLNREGNLRFSFFVTGTNDHFSKQEELIIYRVLMELTQNVIKHSKATEATVQLIYHEDHLALNVEDNGIGLYRESNPGIGLRNIKSRIGYLDGTLRTDSGDHGTTIIINIPYHGNKK